MHTIPALHEDLGDARAARDRKQQVEASLEDLEAACTTAQEQLEQARGSLDDVCETLGVESDADIDELVERYDERRACTEAAEEAEREIARLLGDGENAERARAMLDDGDVAGWDAALERIAEERDELTARRDTLLKERTLAENEIDELGGDDTIPKLALEIEMLQERLNELAHRWAVLEVARQVLDEAVEHFESQQQPVVLETASRLFGQFTCAAWGEVRQVDQRLYATRPDDRELVAAEQLSTGEQAQLYLALRVALATHRDGQLPLLLDDLLQSSDDERADAISST